MEGFWKKVEKTDTCWLWRGAIADTGYGTYKLTNQSTQLAHRVVYERLVGPLINGMQVDHKCGIRQCVNPNHLEQVTQSINMKRAYDRRKRQGRMACNYGHRYTERNTIYLAVGGKICRTCYESVMSKKDTQISG